MNSSKLIKVKSLFNGTVGIPEKYVWEAIEKKLDLEFHCQSEMMIIKRDDVSKKIVGRSERPFKNKFGNNFYYLVYYKWSPIIEQKKLI